METIKKIVLSPELWLSIAIIVLAVILWVVIRKLLRRFVDKRNIRGKKETNIRFGATIAKYLIAVFTVITVLQINGVNVTSLITGLGIAGVIIGFAVQDILKDLIMGTNIVWDEFFSVGDVVRYGDVEGKIIYFNIKVTKLEDINTGSILTISNRNISEIAILSDWFVVRIPAPYEQKSERMRAVCKTICEKIDGQPEVSSCEFLGIDGFGDSQINYLIKIYCRPEKRNLVRRCSLGIIQDIYEENGISVPFPQADIHLTDSNK